MPPPADKPTDVDGLCNIEAHGEEEEEDAVDPSLDMTNKQLFQKHVRFQSAELECRRNFQFACYGGKRPAVVAALAFETKAKEIMKAFGGMGRKPDRRKELLTSHGCEDLVAGRKSIPDQRVGLARQLSGGNSKKMEDYIISRVCQDVLQPGLLDRSSVAYSVVDQKYNVSFTGVKQKPEQSFKSFHDASKWLLQMEAADKDTSVDSNIQIVHTCINIYCIYICVYYIYIYSLLFFGRMCFYKRVHCTLYSCF